MTINRVQERESKSMIQQESAFNGGLWEGKWSTTRYSSRMGNSGTTREQQGMDGGKWGGVRTEKEQSI